MAGRPPKIGLDYAGWSVTIFDNDTKIDKLLDAHGWDGFGIYFYLCQRIYGGEGYFYKWSYDDCASTARKMGGGIGSGTVKETVDYCLRIGLFDKGLFDRWEVLTSRGIQKRYCRAIKDRDYKEVISEYWLLHESEECKGLLKLPLNSDFSEVNVNYPAVNTNYPAGNGNFPTQKESKVNKRKEDISTEQEETADGSRTLCKFILSDGSYCDLTEQDLKKYSELYPAVNCMMEFRKIVGWCEANESKRKTRRGARRFVNGWLSRAQDKAMETKKRPEPVNKNKFMNYKERDYDFKELEEQLINR